MFCAIRNQSKFSNHLIKEILRFLKPFFHKKTFKKLEIHFFDENSKEYRDCISGAAYSWCPKKQFKRLKKQSRYFVQIDIGSKIIYPYRWIYRKSVQPPFIKNKKEDLISVLAHELFHIECMVLNKIIIKEEVYAEKISRRIVKEFRKRAIKKRRRK